MLKQIFFISLFLAVIYPVIGDVEGWPSPGEGWPDGVACQMGWCNNKWSQYPGNVIPPNPNPIVPNTFPVFGEDSENLQKAGTSGSQLADLANAAIQAASVISDIPDIGVFFNLFSSFLDIFGIFGDGDEELMQEIEQMMQTVLTIAEDYTNDAISANDINQIQSNILAAITAINSISNYSEYDFATDQLTIASNNLYVNFYNFGGSTGAIPSGFDSNLPNFLYQYAFYSFNPLYLNAVLHLNIQGMLIGTLANDEEFSAVNSIASQTSQLASGYLTLLQNYTTAAVIWRNQQYQFIDSEGGFTEDCVSCINMQWECEIEGNEVSPSCIYDMDYVANVQTACESYFNNYITAFEQVASTYINIASR